MFPFFKEKKENTKPKLRVDLAWRELKEINDNLVSQYAFKCTELDLSNNKLSDISPLGKFTLLEMLVLDSNRITDHTKIPRMEKLQTLWVNKNRISNLAIFIDKLVEFTPNLKFLSMLNNDACPNYFNGGSLKQYTDYRHYVINRLRNLTMLDDTPVTPQEKEEAIKTYGTLGMKVAREEKEAQRLKELEAKRKEERLERRKRAIERKRKKEEEHRKKLEQEVLSAVPLPSVDGFSNSKSSTPQLPPPAPRPGFKVKDEDDWTDSEDSEDWTDDEER